MNRCVGVFDSGLGGLTVVKELKKKWPGQRIIYLGDTARVPYGTRSPEVIKKFAVECARFLEGKKVDKIIIACNTASAYAFGEVRAAVSVPAWEVISYGAKGTRGSKKIGVIGTRATIGSGRYEEEIKKINPGAEIKSAATPLLVPLVEEGETSGDLIEMAVGKSIAGMAGAETLILGCTHYPVIAPVIKKQLPGVKLVNPGEELAREWPGENTGGEDEYYFTDMTDRYVRVAEMFLGGKLTGKAERIQL